MKKILLFLNLLFITIVSAQCPPDGIMFTSQEMVDNFILQYPNCTELTSFSTFPIGGEIDNLDGLQNITAVTGDVAITANLSNIDGLSSLTTVGGNFTINIPNTSTLTALSNLVYVGGNLDVTGGGYGEETSATDISLNSLTTVGGYFKLNMLTNCQFNSSLVSIGGDLNISLANPVTSLDGFQDLESIGGNFGFSGTGLLELPNMQNLTTIGGNFWVNAPFTSSLQPFNSLASIGGDFYVFFQGSNYEGLNNLHNLGGWLTITGSQLEDISALSNLTSVHMAIAISNTKLVNLNGLHNLVSIYEDGPVTATLALYDNELLTDISALEHINPTDLHTISITNNPSLSNCSLLNFCSALNNLESSQLWGNGTGCNSIEEISLGCNSDHNKIWGTLKYNYNNNDCASFTQNAANIKVKAVSSTGIEYITYSKEDGRYNIYVPEGTYITQAEINNADFTVGTDPVETTFTGVANNENIDFCISPAQIVDDIRVSVFPLVGPRPGFDAIYKIEIKNVGSIVKSGTVTFTFDPAKQTFILGVPGDAVVTDNTVTFTYESLYPLHSEYFSVRFNVLAPPANNIGEVLAYTANVTPVAGDATPENNTVVFNQNLIGSYDPNDKTVMEGDKVLIENAGDYLTYRIRFQNTGTASAIFVRLEDELDTKLDWNTFEPVSASHDNYRIELIDGFLKVYFDNINLAAEADNEPASHGYFMYKVKPKDAVVLGDVISNTASIYFDFNTPIVTNTVTTEYIEETAGLTSPGFSVALYPNPAKTVINFGSGLAITEVTLYNNLGQQVIKTTGTNIKNVNVATLANGVYLCQVKNASGDIAAKKIIISK
jgi:uncharacterized repeat protein (TIGR01451 family)